MRIENPAKSGFRLKAALRKIEGVISGKSVSGFACHYQLSTPFSFAIFTAGYPLAFKLRNAQPKMHLQARCHLSLHTALINFSIAVLVDEQLLL
jgi:hypothetical protein